MRCGVCTFGYTGSQNRSENRQATYQCMNRRLGKVRPCNSPQIRAEWVEQEVRRHIREFVYNPGEVMAMLRDHIAEMEVQPVEVEDRLAEVEERLQERTAAKRRTTDLLVRGVIDEADAKGVLDTLRIEISELEEERQRIGDEANAAVNLSTAVAEVEHLLAELREGIDTLDEEGWREVVELLVAEVTITPKGFRGNRGIPRAVATFRFGEWEARCDPVMNRQRFNKGCILVRELDIPEWKNPPLPNMCLR